MRRIKRFLFLGVFLIGLLGLGYYLFKPRIIDTPIESTPRKVASVSDIDIIPTSIKEEIEIETLNNGTIVPLKNRKIVVNFVIDTSITTTIYTFQKDSLIVYLGKQNAAIASRQPSPIQLNEDKSSTVDIYIARRRELNFYSKPSLGSPPPSIRLIKDEAIEGQYYLICGTVVFECKENDKGIPLNRSQVIDKTINFFD